MAESKGRLFTIKKGDGATPTEAFTIVGGLRSVNQVDGSFVPSTPRAPLGLLSQ